MCFLNIHQVKVMNLNVSDVSFNAAFYHHFLHCYILNCFERLKLNLHFLSTCLVFPLHPLSGDSRTPALGPRLELIVVSPMCLTCLK